MPDETAGGKYSSQLIVGVHCDRLFELSDNAVRNLVQLLPCFLERAAQSVVFTLLSLQVCFVSGGGKKGDMPRRLLVLC